MVEEKPIFYTVCVIRVKPNDNVTESHSFSQMIMLPNGISFLLGMKRQTATSEWLLAFLE